MSIEAADSGGKFAAGGGIQTDDVMTCAGSERFNQISFRQEAESSFSMPQEMELQLTMSLCIYSCKRKAHLIKTNMVSDVHTSCMRI